MKNAVVKTEQAAAIRFWYLDSLPLWVPHGEVGEARAGVPVPLHEPLEDAAQLRPSEAQRQPREVLPTAKQLPVRHRGHAEALLPPENSK